MVAVESFIQNFVQQKHRFRHLVAQQHIGDAEVVFVVEHIQIFNHPLVSDVSAREAHYLVEDGECVAHTSVGLLCNHIQRFSFGLDALFFGHIFQMFHSVIHIHPVEVVDLAPAENGGQNLMLLRGGENEDGMVWGLFQCLQESIESGGTEHVHLVDDEHFVLAYLRRDAHLFDEGTDVFDGVVRSRIQFMNVVRALFAECLARLTLSAGFSFGCQMLAVDGLGKNAGTRCLADTARTTEQVGMGQLAGCDGILQSGSQGALADYRIEVHRTIFSC